LHGQPLGTWIPCWLTISEDRDSRPERIQYFQSPSLIKNVNSKCSIVSTMTSYVYFWCTRSVFSIDKTLLPSDLAWTAYLLLILNIKEKSHTERILRILFLFIYLFLRSFFFWSFHSLLISLLLPHPLLS